VHMCVVQILFADVQLWEGETSGCCAFRSRLASLFSFSNITNSRQDNGLLVERKDGGDGRKASDAAERVPLGHPHATRAKDVPLFGKVDSAKRTSDSDLECSDPPRVVACLVKTDGFEAPQSSGTHATREPAATRYLFDALVNKFSNSAGSAISLPTSILTKF
jgi:hypothetical protein